MYPAWLLIVGHCLLNIILNSKASDSSSQQLDNICWSTTYGWDIKPLTRNSSHTDIYFQSTKTMNQLLSTRVHSTRHASHCLKFEYKFITSDSSNLTVFIINGTQRTAQVIWLRTTRWNDKGNAQIAVQSSHSFEIEIWGLQSSTNGSSIQLKNVLFSESECTSRSIGTIAPSTKTNEVLVAPCTQPNADGQLSVMTFILTLLFRIISSSTNNIHPGTTLSPSSGSLTTHFKKDTALLSTGKMSETIFLESISNVETTLTSAQNGSEKELTMDDDSTSNTAIIIGCTLGAVAFVVAVVVIVLIVKWKKLCPGRQTCCKCCAKCSSKVGIEQIGNQKEH